jgi:hypothetical protein
LQEVTDDEKGWTTDGGKIRHSDDHYLLFHPYALAERAEPDVTATHVISSFEAPFLRAVTVKLENRIADLIHKASSYVTIVNDYSSKQGAIVKGSPENNVIVNVSEQGVITHARSYYLTNNQSVAL